MKKRFAPILLTILALLAIPVAAETSLGSENTSGQNPIHKIAFLSKRDGNFEIYTMNDDGTDLTRVTKSKTDKLMPRWSPDGSKILYLSKNGSRYELWMIESSGQGQTKLADKCSIDSSPLWSPDGSKILFMVKNGFKNEIYVVNNDGGGRVRLTENGLEGSAPSWSPDGSKVLFLQKKKEDISIYLINPDGTGRQKLIKDPGVCLGPIWSSDGKKIAYIFKKYAFVGTENKLHIMNNDGSNDLSIVDVSKKIQDIDFDDNFCLSPDGKQLAYTKVAEVEAQVSESGKTTFIFTYGTYIVAADGNSDENLLGKTGTTRSFPCWSQDSSKVAFLANSKLHIYTLKSGIDTSTGVDASLPLSQLQWSPDGTKIIFAAKNTSFQKAGLFLVDITGKVTKLTESGDYDPVWAPINK